MIPYPRIKTPIQLSDGRVYDYMILKGGASICSCYNSYYDMWGPSFLSCGTFTEMFVGDGGNQNSDFPPYPRFICMGCGGRQMRFFKAYSTKDHNLTPDGDGIRWISFQRLPPPPK